tara:strand:+ start:760 stop:993 length:234 start_codon:yes stop_codon:yes gene_type:complete
MSKYIFLRSKDMYIDESGNVYEATKNGNVNTKNFKTLLNFNGVWWNTLSPRDYKIVNEIWLKFTKLGEYSGTNESLR